MKDLIYLLELLEDKLDDEHIKKVEQKYISSLNFHHIKTPPIRITFPLQYKSHSMIEAHENFEKMMYNELLNCIGGVLIKDDSLPMIRANYGVGITPSLFGLKSVIINNNMPWVEHLGSIEAVRNLLTRGVPSLDTGLGKKVRETHEFYSETLSNYPKCKKHIKIFHPDLQGPMDIAHLIWGSDIYLVISILIYKPFKFVSTFQRHLTLHSNLR